jgi:anti-sigma B factor antagonist
LVHERAACYHARIESPPRTQQAGVNLTIDRAEEVAIVRVNETRLLYPLLSDFANSVTALITAGERRLVIDLSSVSSVDSATIGCLMDLHREAAEAGGVLKLAGVQKRVETMLTMTGAHDVLEVHPDEPSAIRSFG